MAVATSGVRTAAVQMGTVMVPTIHILLPLACTPDIALAITFLAMAAAPPAMAPAASTAVIPLEVRVLALAAVAHSNLDLKKASLEQRPRYDGIRMDKRSANGGQGFQRDQASKIYHLS
uniref:Uncharacterized protein n=1 Tax=Sphaerodactylus townsendi TaxID=933632 RepID=A0ACB8G6E2_9SAUR